MANISTASSLVANYTSRFVFSKGAIERTAFILLVGQKQSRVADMRSALAPTDLQRTFEAFFKVIWKAKP